MAAVRDPVVAAVRPSRPGSELVVETDALTKRYGSRAVVDGLGLSVRRGEVFGFLGPNGAGKTTTLRMLLGLVRPSCGTATLLGRPAGDREALARVGALVEGPGFYPFLSARQNLRVLARYAGASPSRVEPVLQVVDLADRAGDRYSTYSLGMKQRLGVAAALLKDPELVVLDEPTNGLDPAGMADMRVLLRRLADEGRSVLLSSHLLGEVQQLCERIAVIANGRLVAETTVDELRGRGRLMVAAEPLGVAADVASGLLGADRVSLIDGELHVAAEGSDVPRLNRALVGAGVDVSELRLVARTLEEAFLEMTGGDLAGEPVPAEVPGSRSRLLRRRAGDVR